MINNDLKVLKSYGWTVECESPFEISHKDGSRASGTAAERVVSSVLREDDQEESADDDRIEVRKCHLDIPVPAIDVKHFAEITQRRKDAEFGYGRVGYLEYFKDTSALLKERKELLEYIEELREVIHGRST